MKRFMAMVLCACCGLAGCGYTTHTMISQQFRTIHVVPFVNKIDITKENEAASKYKIYKPGLETAVTRAVSNKYLFDGNLKPVDQSLADVTLKGELTEFRRDPLRYTDNDEVEEYRVNIVVNLTLFDNHTQKVLWQESNFTGDTTYFARGAAAKTDDVAVNDAITDLARRIVDRTVEQW